jgi:hypothetical protein
MESRVRKIVGSAQERFVERTSSLFYGNNPIRLLHAPKPKLGHRRSVNHRALIAESTFFIPCRQFYQKQGGKIGFYWFTLF